MQMKNNKKHLHSIAFLDSADVCYAPLPIRHSLEAEGSVAGCHKRSLPWTTWSSCSDVPLWTFSKCWCLRTPAWGSPVYWRRNSPYIHPTTPPPPAHSSIYSQQTEYRLDTLDPKGFPVGHGIKRVKADLESGGRAYMSRRWVSLPALQTVDVPHPRTWHKQKLPTTLPYLQRTHSMAGIQKVDSHTQINCSDRLNMLL